MPRFAKGSKEAKEWAAKMREARNSKKMSGGAVAPPSRMPQSAPEAEMAGGKIGKAFSKGIKTLNKANPIMLAIKDKKTRGAMTTSGDIAYNYALPAAVEVGKPALDAAAMAASTAITGNPVAGKVIMDTLWDKMVAEKGYDPRDRQKSRLLGSVSKDAGKVAGQETRAKLGKGIRPMDSLTESTGKSKYRTLGGQGMCMECPECMGMGIKMKSSDIMGEGGGASKPKSIPANKDRAEKLANDIFQYATKLHNVENTPYLEVMDYLDAEIERHKADGYKTEEMGYRMAKRMFKKYKEGV
jgi:hypothetical protein